MSNSCEYGSKLLLYILNSRKKYNNECLYPRECVYASKDHVPSLPKKGGFPKGS